MPKYCHECGEPIKEGNNFCENCGATIAGQAASIGIAVPKKHSGPGITSLVLGIISMCLIWLSFFPLGIGLWAYLLILLPIGIIGTILGGLAFWGKWKDKFGLAGFILSLLVIILGLVFVLLFGYLIYRIF